MLAATFLVYTSKIGIIDRILCGVFKIHNYCVLFIENASFKSSGVTDCLSRTLISSQWTKETAVASFQLKDCLQLATAPIL